MPSKSIQQALTDLRNQPDGAAMLDLARFKLIEVEFAKDFTPDHVVPIYQRLDDALDCAWRHLTQQIGLRQLVDADTTLVHQLRVAGKTRLVWSITSPVATEVTIWLVKRS